jgi:hypothetical protein
MNASTKPTRLRLIVWVGVLLPVGCVLVLGAFSLRRAQREARRSNAYGRLCQMTFILHNYQARHGTLPPLCLRDDQGKPIHSWRALILPYLELPSTLQLDLSQAWNSEDNLKVIDRLPIEEWTWFARDWPSEQSPAATHVFALVGANSIWETTTGLPKGTTKECRNAILLVSVPESSTPPMQPRDITEDEVREMVEKGHEVLFIMADVPAGYGVVTIEHGSLAFHTWRETLDRKDRTP